MLKHELGVIADLQIADFFLIVREVVAEANRRGIRCAGRGSAANSIVAYALGITGVDPLAHNFLFERFLHRGRKGTPDIDLDFDSARRDEMIQWIEARFGADHTAMTATLIPYRLRSALRDTAKALGWPLETVDRLTARVPRRHAADAGAYREDIEAVLGTSPLVDTLIDAAEGLEGCPRHLGLHSGGMVLSRTPLARLSPVQRSAGGVRQATLEEEARQMGVATLLPCIHRSAVRFSLEAHPLRLAGNHRNGSQEEGYAIRKPLTAIRQVSEDLARTILWARAPRPFASIEDLFERVPMTRGALEALARSGALDVFAGDSRRALWKVGVLLRSREARPRAAAEPTLFAGTADGTPRLSAADLPNLPPLPEAERLVWDLETHQAPRRHTMTLVRRRLAQLEVRPIDTCYRLGGYMRLRKEATLTVAGIVILRQRPGSAHGVDICDAGRRDGLHPVRGVPARLYALQRGVATECPGRARPGAD